MSANEIVPIIMDLVNPASVVDVGCGIGTFLSVFKKCGVLDILGVDGDYVERKMLLIPKTSFLPHDLSKPLKLERTFDLVLSLEVAEHINDEFSDVFVNSLINLGEVILFSAAVPYQGGTSHINEQWPEYWVEKFLKHKYLVIDGIRRKIWSNKNVKFWYAQNMLLFVREDSLNHFPKLEKEREATYDDQLSIVHPTRYLQMGEKLKNFKDPNSIEIGELTILFFQYLMQAIKATFSQKHR